MVGDYEPIEAFLVGQGLSVRQAAEVTFKEYLLRLKAYEKKKTEDWERTRWQTFVAARVAGSKVKRPQDLMKLPTDEREFVRVEVSDEDIQALINIGLIK